jgi:aminodeoxyfutalosine deaminase
MFATAYRPDGTVGIGLGGPEAARRRNYRPGEVWAALRELGTERIGHGSGAAADPDLLRHLAVHGIALEACLASNVCTGAVPLLGQRTPADAIFCADA